MSNGDEGCSYSGEHDPNGNPIIDGHIVGGKCVSYGYVAVDVYWETAFLSPDVDAVVNMDPFLLRSPSGEAGGVVEMNPVQSNQKSDQTQAYRDCIRNSILHSAAAQTVAGAKIYLWVGLMAVGSAVFSWAFVEGFRSVPHELFQPNGLPFGGVINAVGSPGHFGFGTGVPGGVAYFTGYYLADQGLNTARLSPSATRGAANHCHDLYPNAR